MLTMEPAPQTGTRTAPLLRALGVGLFIGLLWSIDKALVRHLPEGSLWHYIVSGVFIALGLSAMLALAARITGKKT